MSAPDHTPAWLFSFVDLAFLLLLALTQIGVEPGGITVDLGEILVPRIRTDEARDLPAAPQQRWQLRVHPPVAGGAPFELAGPAARGGATTDASPRFAADALRARLVLLRGADEPRPLLAPHGDSRTQDLLAAASLVEELWPGRRRATIAPLVAGR
ncbi:MAG TPA: hypothetical protein VFG80_06060 [Myxococcota bacterium]|nr:hypothetical protein [Myxococcota bacterium]